MELHTFSVRACVCVVVVVVVVVVVGVSQPLPRQGSVG